MRNRLTMTGSLFIKKRDVLTAIFLFLIIFQSIIERKVSAFFYFDELLSLAVFCFALFQALCIKKKLVLNKCQLGMIVCIAGYALCGTISSLIYQYQTVQNSIFAGFISIKWFLLFFGVMILAELNALPRIESLNEKLIVGMIYLVTVWEFASLHTGALAGYGFALWDLCAKCVFLMALLFCIWDRIKALHRITCVLCLWLLLLSTGRSKGYGAIAVSVAILFWVIWKKHRFRIFHMLLMGIAAICVAWEKIYYYYIHGVSHFYARPVLFQKSFEVANDFFPFGTGLGTFCSHIASTEYSPVYFYYGISEHPELGVQRKLYLADAYWPSVIAESGWIALGFIAIFLILLLCLIQKKSVINTNYYGAGLLIWCYVIIISIEETGFMQPVIMCLAIVLGMIIKTGYKNSVC